MADDTTNLVIANLLEVDPEIREPQIALLFEDTEKQLTQRWYIVSDDHCRNYEVKSINGLLKFDGEEDLLDDLEAQFGPAQIVGLTYDMAPYCLGQKEIGSLDHQNMLRSIAQKTRRAYLAQKAYEANKDETLDWYVAEIKSLSRNEFRERIKPYREALIEMASVTLTREQVEPAWQQFVMMELDDEKAIRESYIEERARESRFMQRHLRKAS